VIHSDKIPDSQFTADEALQRLIEGNRRFVRGDIFTPWSREDIFARLVKEQRPYAMILGCADSRVPPELIFGAGLGDLFVVRVAGNVLSPGVAGSLQYAAVHLYTPLLVILGHEGCGAVKAALKTKWQGPTERSRIQILVNEILPALSGIEENLDPEAQVTMSVEANVRWTMQEILASPEGKIRQAEGRVKMVGAIYELATGNVRWLE